MDRTTLIDACSRLSFRQARNRYGVSQNEWSFIRKHGNLPPDRRGRPVNTLLTTAILELVKVQPHFSQERIAHEIGCSHDKVESELKKNPLNLMWQRLRYAGVELKELDPDLHKARETPIQADGPGALVHMDAKRYGALAGGILIVGIIVIDNYSAFSSLFLCPDGRKTGENSVAALQKFAESFPAGIRKLYSDNGSEFVNSKVITWCNDVSIKFSQTKTGHPWSNGKAERTQALFKREVILPVLIDRRFNAIPELQEAIDGKILWFNHERPHFGRINRGLSPAVVAAECAKLDTDEAREARLKEFRASLRHKNRQDWERNRQEKSEVSE